MSRRLVLFCLTWMLCYLPSLQAASEEQPLVQQTESLKERVIALNRDLFILEEDLLHPAASRLGLYVSMDMGQFFNLESVKVKLDGSPVTSFLYTQRDIQALMRGAIQPLFVDNIASGQHELVVLFTGTDRHNRPIKRAVSMEFTKESEAKDFEIQILDSSDNQQIDFKVKPWQ